MDINHIHLQYDRLARHHQAAMKTKDPISFLDLAHALRIWVDLKVVVTQLASKLSLDLPFRHNTQLKYLKKTLKGAQHTYIPIAGGVESPRVQLKGIAITNRALTPEEIKARAAMGPPISQVTSLTYAQWLVAGVLEVPSSNPKHPHLLLSREIIINRVANKLGASHPAGMKQEEPQSNKFDPYIEELHTIILAGGYPATYYQLLEIAGGLLDATRPLRDHMA